MTEDNHITMMAGWPRTPGAERLERADRMIGKDARHGDPDPRAPRVWDRPDVPEQLARDCRTLVKYPEIWERTWAQLDRMRRLAGRRKPPAAAELAKIAARGSDRTFIGMVIDNHGDRMATALYRDPGWTGLNHALPDCRGLWVHILGDPEANREPELVLAVPPGSGLEQLEHEPAQEGLPLAVRETVLWHGAAGCRWHPQGLGK